MPNLIPDWLPWMRPAGRLIWACALMAIGLGIAFWLFKRPKPDRPATWSECMAGAVGVFGLMTLAYAVIPHEWITFSDKYLQWDTTKFVFRSSQDIFFLPVHWPFTMDKKAVRDIIVTGTPTGAGVRFDPPRFLAAGDRVEVDVPGVGTLANTVVDESGDEVV